MATSEPSQDCSPRLAGERTGAKPDSPEGGLASDHLNLIRGLAAVAVLAFHVRYRFFLDYADLTSPSAWERVFYTLTAFGHDAVMVFFVLSGYFISGSVIRDRRSGRWSWTKYVTNRLVRLHLVLLPGLVLTLLWDGLGLTLFPQNPVYSGAPRPWVHDFYPVADRLSLPIFLGNVFFLQAIRVPPLGSNGPLWSLSYEFWYYVLFPCAWLALTRGPTRWWKRAAYLGTCVALLAVLGREIALYFPIWLMGTAVTLLPRVPAVEQRPAVPTLAALVVFAVATVATHLGAVKAALGNSILLADYVTGVSFTIFLYILLHLRAPSTRPGYAAVARGLAGFSYTLYVVHMPILVFARAALVPDEPWSPDAAHVAAGGVIGLAVIGYAMAVARVTEAKTDAVRSWVLRRVRAVFGGRA